MIVVFIVNIVAVCCSTRCFAEFVFRPNLKPRRRRSVVTEESPGIMVPIYRRHRKQASVVAERGRSKRHTPRSQLPRRSMRSESSNPETSVVTEKPEVMSNWFNDAAFLIAEYHITCAEDLHGNREFSIASFKRQCAVCRSWLPATRRLLFVTLRNLLKNRNRT